MSEWFVIAPAIVLAILTLPGTIELLGLTLFGARSPRRSKPASEPYEGRLTFVVPAHDEARTIRSCLASLPLDSSEGAVDCVVVADNCTDDTARIAASLGVRVLERLDSKNRGKGHALHHAFRILLDEGVETIVVLDADSQLEPGFVTALRAALGRGENVLQAAYLVANASHSRRTRLLNVALTAFNLVRPRARERLGLSVGILGNGFCLRREVLERVPYDAHSVVEDLEYHLLLVRNGFRVAFVEDAVVRSDMPSGKEATATQRARWEGGRYRMILQWVPRLAADVARGRLRSLEPLLELLLLPLAHHVLLLLSCLALPSNATRLYAGLALLLVAVHALVALRAARGGMRDLLTLATAPFYVLWKLTMTVRIARAGSRNASWVRTQREIHP